MRSLSYRSSGLRRRAFGLSFENAPYRVNTSKHANPLEEKPLMQTAFLDCREDYDAAMRGLASDPDNSAFQYRAVLALARAGSLEQARAAYEKYQLDQHTDNEDFLSLGGRLLKDASLRLDGAELARLAATSAAQYQVAFAQTGGYYSGINAATMMFLAGGDADEVSSRTRQVLSVLPDVKTLSDQDAYFVLATQAEALLLLSDLAGAQSSLIDAWAREPLNYINHAATLKQLKLISEQQGIDTSWLATFSPPKAAQFAGQMFSIGEDGAPGTNISTQDEAQMRDEIIQLIQDQDIGFFFGALSAGFDILAAETVLEEGGEVHVVLPVEVDGFRSASVVPFGEGWGARFDNVLDQANSVDIVLANGRWPDRGLNQYAAKIAMGHAIHKANLLSAEKIQVLGFADPNVESYTRDHKLDWRRTGYGTLELKIPGSYQNRFKPEEPFQEARTIEVLGFDQDGGQISHHGDVVSAARWAIERRSQNANARLGVSCAYAHDDPQTSTTVKILSEKALPGSTLVSEHFACLLAVEAEREFAVSYVGRIDPSRSDSPGVYSLASKI